MTTWHPAGDVRALHQRRVERDATLFLALDAAVRQREAHVPGELPEAMRAVLSDPPTVAHAVFELPHIRQWMLTLREFVVHNLHTSGVTERLLVHAFELHRLRLAASLRVGASGAIASVVVPPNRSVHLPGLGRYHRYPEGSEGSIVRVGSEACSWENSELVGCELWTSDLLVRKPGSRAYEFPEETSSEVAVWRAAIADFQAELLTGWPLLAREMPVLLRGIVHVECAEEDKHLSGTFGEVPGALYLSWTSNVHVLREALVHEAFHTRLNLMLDGVDVRPFSGSPLFWAPWRFSQRPTVAFVHGVYATLGMFRYNATVVRQRTGAPWQEKLATHWIRLELARWQWNESVAVIDTVHPIAQVWRDVDEALEAFAPLAPVLMDDLLVVCAGERGEIHRALRDGIVTGSVAARCLNGLDAVVRRFLGGP